MSGHSAMESEHEELRLLKEALWYSKWSLAFTIAALVVEVIALIELFQDNFKAVFMLMVLACVVYLFARYLGTRAKQLRYLANEISNERY